MRVSTSLKITALLGAGVALVGAPRSAPAQTRGIIPEQQLLGVRLGRPYLEVIRRFGAPTELQTVALASSPEQLPGLGGSGGGAPDGGLGAMNAGSGMGAGGGGASSGGMMMGPPPGFGGASSGGGGASSGGMMMGPPPGFGGASSGGGGNGPSMGGMMGGSPGGSASGGAGPEYSTALLWIYQRKEARIEFLINEDGRVAQISVASPADKPFPGVRTQRGVAMGDGFTRVMESYGNPERHRLLPGARFYEAFYSKDHHAAFTFDTRKQLRVVRVTIALAD